MIVGIVAAFLAAAAAAKHMETSISNRSNDLIGNAMPSVQYLSSASGELHAMESAVERMSDPSADRAELLQDAETGRRNIDQLVALYVALPYFPHERELFSSVIVGLKDLDRHHRDWIASPTPETLATLRRDFVAVDAALQRIVSFDAEQGQRLGREIEHVRRQSQNIETLLNAVAVAASCIAATLALRQLRRAARESRRALSERERREAELITQNEALGQFAGRVAHDILSPLSTAMLSFDLARRGCEHDRPVVRALERGSGAIDRVHTLVDGLLAFARAGGQPEVGLTTELAPVLNDVVDDLSMRAQQASITLTLEPVPIGAMACSRGVLMSLVTNLVQNAIKYMGDAKERRVVVRVLDADSRWRVEVTDSGRGISEEEQQHIFEPYVQIVRGGGGIGLGLATVDRLVRAHSGSGGVRSKLGAGSTFWFELPKPLIECAAAKVHGLQAAAT